MAISGIIAYTAGTEEIYFKYFLEATEVGFKPTMLFYVVAFAPLGLGLLIQMAYQRLSFGLLLILFMLFSVLMGLSLSSVMLVYAGKDIAITFFVSAGAFGGMAILGYTTQTDLTKFGSLLYMVFIGMFIEIFGFDWSFGLAILGVFVFTGLTAYYMQQLKGIAQDQSLSHMDRSKLALVGGLQLYILFVNLFLSLLRLIGGRD